VFLILEVKRQHVSNLVCTDTDTDTEKDTDTDTVDLAGGVEGERGQGVGKGLV